jgi:hypothetical protein
MLARCREPDLQELVKPQARSAADGQQGENVGQSPKRRIE